MHRKFADSYWAHSYQGTPSTTLLHEEIFKNVIALLMQHVQSQISFPEMDFVLGSTISNPDGPMVLDVTTLHSRSQERISLHQGDQNFLQGSWGS